MKLCIRLAKRRPTALRLQSARSTTRLSDCHNRSITPQKKTTNKTTPGQIVDDFIKETKKEVKAYKKDMRDWKPE